MKIQFTCPQCGAWSLARLLYPCCDTCTQRAREQLFAPCHGKSTRHAALARLTEIERLDLHAKLTST